MNRLLRLDFKKPEDRNAWYLIWEIFWATFLGAATTFNTAFAIRLGASDTQVGWLTSLPALLALFVLIPAGRFLGSLKNQKPWLLGSLAIYRTGYLVVAIIPWLGFLGISQGALLVGWLVVLSIPATFFNVGWIPMLSDVVPAENRANVFTARNVVYNAALSVSVYLLGQWLKHVSFPQNYQLMYAVTYFVSLVSLFLLVKMHVPDRIARVEEDAPKAKRPSLRESLLKIYHDFKEHPDFATFVRNTLFHSIFLWMVSPLYMLYYVRALKADDAWIGLLGSISCLAVIVGFLIWRPWMIRLGEQRVLRYTIILAGLYPFLVGLSHSLNLILVWVVINGVVSGGISLSHLNVMMRVTPEHDRPGFTALYMTIMNAGAFVTPMIGVALSQVFGFSAVLAVCGVLSILGSFSFWIWRIRLDS